MRGVAHASRSLCASPACVGALDAHPRPRSAAAARLIKIVVPFSPGGSNDVIARAIAGPLAKRLDIPVIVENKAGAAGVVGADYVAKSPRDGSVLLLTSSSFLTAAATQSQLPYDPIDGVRAGRDGRARTDAPRRLGDHAVQDAGGRR